MPALPPDDTLALDLERLDVVDGRRQSAGQSSQARLVDLGKYQKSSLAVLFQLLDDVLHVTLEVRRVVALLAKRGIGKSEVQDDVDTF